MGNSLQAFQGVLAAGAPSFMPTQVVVVPPLVVEALGGKSAKRVVGTLNGHAVRLGLLPLPGGGRYLMGDYWLRSKRPSVMVIILVRSKVLAAVNSNVPADIGLFM